MFIVHHSAFFCATINVFVVFVLHVVREMEWEKSNQSRLQEALEEMRSLVGVCVSVCLSVCLCVCVMKVENIEKESY